MDFFWNGLHWVPQCILHLSRDKGGHGLIQLSSRVVAFLLQFLQKFLTGSKSLLWRGVAWEILHRLDRPLSCMDTRRLNLTGLLLSPFYQGPFQAFSHFKLLNEDNSSLRWLLEEPFIHGDRLDGLSFVLSGIFASI